MATSSREVQLSYKVILPKSFSNQLRKLNGQGLKKIVQAAKAAMAEAGTDGEINSLPRTKHGESRLPDIEKYDLPDAFRLVVQVVDGKSRQRAFLFIGNHDDAQQWLDNHKNYRWVRRESDGVLDFVQVTDNDSIRHIPIDRIELDADESALEEPLLRQISDAEWKVLKIADDAIQVAKSATGASFEQDAEGILEKLDTLTSYDTASLILDLLWHAHKSEWAAFRQRLDLACGASNIIEAEAVSAAMTGSENSESFVTFDDDHDLLNQFLQSNTIADWMLFLHPEQKSVVDRDFKGPARLRGVSGSGKTCVLVHRARALAKRYGQPVLLVTLTESMRRLLDRLADDLCGAERSLIETRTMSALTKEVYHEYEPRRPSRSNITAAKADEIIQAVAQRIVNHPDYRQSPFANFGKFQLVNFLRAEIPYIRGRLTEDAYQQYLDAQNFQRIGRGTKLNQAGRALVFSALTEYASQLEHANAEDPEGWAARSLALLKTHGDGHGKYRCVLSDEVQDLSEIDVALLSHLMTPSGTRIGAIENGLFLAGDGTQSIYKRGFVLKRIGIDVAGRSINLKKNYRNTHEILTAAFGLVSAFEFADVDDDNITKPSPPEFAKRHGSRPLLLRCSSLSEEAEYIAGKVQSLLTMGQVAGQVCIIGPNNRTRDEVSSALKMRSIATVDLRSNVDYESDSVKISTIESAKGHEFGAVFIMGLVEGVLPGPDIAPDEMSREAARLYVAMTRARDTLTLTYSAAQDVKASRFSIAIQGDCDEAHLRNGQVRKVA